MAQIRPFAKSFRLKSRAKFEAFSVSAVQPKSRIRGRCGPLGSRHFRKQIRRDDGDRWRITSSRPHDGTSAGSNASTHLHNHCHWLLELRTRAASTGRSEPTIPFRAASRNRPKSSDGSTCNSRKTGNSATFRSPRQVTVCVICHTLQSDLSSLHQIVDFGKHDLPLIDKK